jgi:hypothetical protein
MDDPTTTAAEADSAAPRARLLLFAVTASLVAWPFLVVTLPPVADLPQHAAQLGLFSEALSGDGPYRVQWTTPYSLAYLPLALGRLLFGPFAGARLAVAAIAVAWAAALHLVAWRLRRPAAAAVAASVLAFNHALYWGFLPFLVGFPLFVVWSLLVDREPRPGWRPALLFAAGGLLLYFAHALWFAAGLAWLAVDALLRWRGGTPWRALLARLAGAGTVGVAAFGWYLSIASTSFNTPPLWVPDAWRRLLPSTWVEAAFGGLSGPLEPVVVALLAAWLAAAAWAGWRQRGEGEGAAGWHRRLALAALLFAAGALLLPDKLTNTIEFNDRWLPPALALLLVAAPPLPLRRGLARAAAVTLLAVFVAFTAVAWQQAEEEELAGLMPALAALPEEPTLLGLDFVRGSRWLDRQPYLQTFAWGQVLHGGTLNFSFADFPPSPVVYDPPRHAPWTPGLEWFPQAVRREDFGWFDHVLVRAGADLHARFAAEPWLTPVTPLAPWVLYRVEAGAPRGRFERPRRQGPAQPR